MNETPLTTPTLLGELALPNRVVMAPLTRMRAGANNVPTELAATYYAQRASAGLIVSEATQVSQQGAGYPATPGIHSDEQVAGWRRVTDAVHAKGGRIVLQLWHVGRISHSSIQPGGGVPVAPSAIRPAGGTFTAAWKQVPFETPRALETEEIPGIVADYRRAAGNARAAGFDGVEVHGANGYLLDQFLEDGTNRRTDSHGGSIPNRARLLLEVVDTVIGVWGEGRVGVRLSPFGTFNDVSESDPIGLFGHVARELSARRIAYLHLIEPRAGAAGMSDETNAAAPSLAPIRKAFDGPVVAAGGFTRESAEEAIREGHADAVAFGRLFIANPDLPERLARKAPLNRYDRKTFYGGDAQGYTDYPALPSVA